MQHRSNGVPRKCLLPARALVAFGGRADLWWLRFLKPGFRHCFLCVELPQGWLLLDPRSPMTDLALLPAQPAECLARELARAGYLAVPTWIRRAPPSKAPLALFTCVEAVKRLLGLHSRLVITPWQLFRHLTEVIT